jgi:uncharacterized protein (UPF0333 family)
MKHKVRLLFGVLAALVVVAFMSQDDATTTTEVSDTSAAVEATAGYKVAIDADTGEFTEPAVVDDADAPKPVNSPLSRSAEGLVEEDDPIGGGKRVNLQGRYMNTYTATVSAEGDLTIDCDTGEATTDSEGSDR